MNLQEWKKLKSKSYEEVVAYLNEKYGQVTDSYYRYNDKGTLSQGHPQRQGLNVHHVKEDTVANLCEKTVAMNNPIEYQQPENLVYCDLLEHFYLHILITENLNKENFEDLGINGCKWIAANINDKYKDLDKESKKVYLKLINRFCTSSYIRLRIGNRPEALLQKICQDRLDNNLKEKMVASAKETSLFDWNVGCFADLLNYFKTDRTAIVKICTGGGKTSTACEYLRVNDCKGLVLAPTRTITDTWQESKDKYGSNIDIMTYQTFMNCYKTVNYSKYGAIICDEVHHTDAPRWGEGIQFILDTTDLKIIGLTATTSAEQDAAVDKYFGGRICYGLDLADGIRQGVIHPFSYISALYRVEHDDFKPYGSIGDFYEGKLRLDLSLNPISKILAVNMPKGNRKIIVFVQSSEDIDDAVNAMQEYNPNFKSEKYLRVIYSKKDNKYNAEAKKWFNDTNNHDVCLVTINMANEGAHYEGVNTLVMFRRTNSVTLYLQQLGRIVVTTLKDNPNGIVFDFTNNAKWLLAKRNIVFRKKTDKELNSEEKLKEAIEEVEEDLDKANDKNLETIKDIQDAIKEKAEERKIEIGNVVVYKDYTEDCMDTLSALKETTSKDSTNAKIYVELTELGKELQEDLSFEYDLWKNLKTDDKNGTVNILYGKAKKSETKDIKNKSSNNKKKSSEEKKAEKGSVQVHQVRANDAEKIATAYKLLVRRAYNEGVLQVKEDSDELKIKDQVEFRKLAKRVGFGNTFLIQKAMNNLKKHTFILISKLDI